MSCPFLVFLLAVLVAILGRYRYVLVHTRAHRAQARARVQLLETAIRAHRDQKADDRCWLDDADLYRVLGDGAVSDARVGDKAAMLANCARFIERRCLGGGWPTYAELEAELERNRHSLRTRPDYDFRCQRCGAPHNLDTSIPSEAWNVIVERGPGRDDKYGALCTICIDDLLAEKGLTTEAEFYYVGKVLRGRPYSSPNQGDIEHAERQILDRVLHFLDHGEIVGGSTPWLDAVIQRLLEFELNISDAARAEFGGSRED